MSWAGLDVARCAALEELYRGRSVLTDGLGLDAIAVLLERGARSVCAVGTGSEQAPTELAQFGRRCELRAALPSQSRFDVLFTVLTPPGAPADERDPLDHLSHVARRCSSGGWLIAGAAPDLISDRTLAEALGEWFPRVTMLGQTTLRCASLAPLADEEAEAYLDARLLDREEPEMLVAVGGPRQLTLGYGLVLLSPAWVEASEGQARAVQTLETELAAAKDKLALAEDSERNARRRLAEVEEERIRLDSDRQNAEAEKAAATAQQMAELRAAVDKQKARADDLQREAWAHLKARSEAEAAAAEVREDTVRKLKDARKVANLELMRAMEEATKKAVALKEDLTQTEKERKEAVAALKAAVEERDRLRAQPQLPSGLPDELSRLQDALERECQRLAGIEEGLHRLAEAASAPTTEPAMPVVQPVEPNPLAPPATPETTHPVPDPLGNS